MLRGQQDGGFFSCFLYSRPPRSPRANSVDEHLYHPNKVSVLWINRSDHPGLGLKLKLPPAVVHLFRGDAANSSAAHLKEAMLSMMRGFSGGKCEHHEGRGASWPAGLCAVGISV